MTTIPNARKYSLGAAYLALMLRLCLLFCVSLIVLAALAIGLAALTPLIGGRQLLFQSDVSGNNEIYLYDLYKDYTINLTNHPAQDIEPALSPDGSRITFTSDRAGVLSVFVMDRVGRFVEQRGGEGDVRPSWSPDGQFIVYERQRSGINLVFVVPSVLPDDNYTPRPFVDADSGDKNYDWSPDRQWVAFESYRDGNQEIYIRAASSPPTEGVRNLSNHPAGDWSPRWSPDGSRIAFFSNRAGDWELYTITPDGETITRLTHDPSLDMEPVWSPDGSQLAFLSFRGGGWNLFAIDMTDPGYPVRQLTFDNSEPRSVHWSRDAQYIAYESTTGSLDIYVIDMTTLQVTNITNGFDSRESNASWWP